MKNVTISLDEKVAAWARVYAARRNISPSRYLGEILHRQMHEAREYENAMKRYLSKPPSALSKPGDPYPTREELHDRVNLR